MRQRASSSNMSVHAIAGTYVVLLAFDLKTAASRREFLGFAIHRTDHTENQRYWLKGYRVFEDVLPDPKPGSLHSTLEHPVQDFMWGDYTANPGHHYTYKVVPLYGSPKNISEGESVAVSVNTEPVDEGTHAIYFNRGAAGSQAYARRFENKTPDKVPDRAAYTWLSRGLEEALLAFIGQAKNAQYQIRAAVYEFSYTPVLEAFKKAADAGADVQIIYDQRSGNDSAASARKAVRDAGLTDNVIPRETNGSFISHNKFIVLLKKDGGAFRPVEVWTGSTNITESGIFGHSNVGHVVRDEAVAESFLSYWERLSTDPEAKNLRTENVEASPTPATAPNQGTTCIFSPRYFRKADGDPDALDWYAERMAKAKSCVFFTAAFGINQRFQDVLTEDEDFLRFILLESYGESEAAAKIRLLRRDREVRIAAGAVLDTENALHRWIMKKERLTGLNTHVKFIHTKYLIVDPLSDDPLIITGSANFSAASTRDNDENMLIIRGDTRVADIYLGEFMRLFEHYQFRDIARRAAQPADSAAHKPVFLDPTDAWTRPWFDNERPKNKQRETFA